MHLIDFQIVVIKTDIEGNYILINKKFCSYSVNVFIDGKLIECRTTKNHVERLLDCGYLMQMLDMDNSTCYCKFVKRGSPCNVLNISKDLLKSIDSRKRINLIRRIWGRS